MAKERFYDRAWWQAALAATFGTLVGILLTFGITYWLQREDQADMARKVTKITLHNLDVSIGQMREMNASIRVRDSLFHVVEQYMPDRLGELSRDTLQFFLTAMEQRHQGLTDRKSENIFSNSFEVWQYLDDVKVIGRISNCYSFIDTHHEFAEEYYNCLTEAWLSGWREYAAKGDTSQVALVRAMMNQPQMQLLMRRSWFFIQVLDGTGSIVERLNERNKEVIGIPEEELKEVGNLLEQNSYEIRKD